MLEDAVDEHLHACVMLNEAVVFERRREKRSQFRQDPIAPEA